MSENKVTKIKKRDGRIVDFDQSKITSAIFKAITATNQGDGVRSKKISDKVIQILSRRFKKDEIPQVEQIQDIVEEVLILENLVETARSYILYREQRRIIRDAVGAIDESTEMIDKYIQELDWQVYENANMAYSLQGLNYYGVSTADPHGPQYRSAYRRNVCSQPYPYHRPLLLEPMLLPGGRK